MYFMDFLYNSKLTMYFIWTVYIIVSKLCTLYGLFI